MRRRWLHGAAALVAAALAGAVVAPLARPWPIVDPARRAAVAARLAASSGLGVEQAGPMVLRLLPLPTVEVESLSMRGLGGAVALDADRLTGRLAVSALLRGDLRVVAATLDAPTLVVDLDRVLPLLDAMVSGPASQAGAPSSAARPPAAGRLRILQTGGLTLRAGVLRLLSGDPRRDTLISDIAATVAWPDDSVAASVGGTMVWRGAEAAFDAEIATPERLGTAKGSPVSAHLDSTLLTLGFSGALSVLNGPHGQGRIATATRDLPGLLRALATPAPQLQGFATASLGGTATLVDDRLALSDADLGLDDMRFEGAVTIHGKPGRPGLAGTLATNRLDLGPFVHSLPPLQDPGGAWSDRAMAARAMADDDIDLRISASHASVDGLRFEDGSLSLQSGNGRMELSLGEAHAYDGLVKGRVVATADNDRTDVRADLSVSRLDVSKLSRDLAGSTLLTGVATGHVILEGQGRSPAALIGSLSGRGQVSLRNGAVGARLADWVATTAPSAETGAGSLGEGRIFESAVADFDVTGGSAVLKDGWILWPDLRAAVTGSASVPLQRLDFRAVAGPTAETEGAGDMIPATYVLRGPWARPRFGLVDGAEPGRRSER